MHQLHTLLRTKSIIQLLGLIYFPSQICRSPFMLKLWNLALCILEIIFYTVRKHAWGSLIQIPEHLADRRFFNRRHVQSVICMTTTSQTKGDPVVIWHVSLEWGKVLLGHFHSETKCIDAGWSASVWMRLQCSQGDPSQDSLAPSLPRLQLVMVLSPS